MNDRTGLSLNTLARIFKRELGVELQFNRLSEAEGKILFWFAIYREPVPIAEIRKSVVGSASGRSVPQQVNSLIRRSLIEKYRWVIFLTARCDGISHGTIDSTSLHRVCNSAA